MFRFFVSYVKIDNFVAKIVLSSWRQNDFAMIHRDVF